MKHFSPGFSDSIASVIAHPAQCPHCESFSHIGGGLCVGCLLQTGLEPDDACAGETLGSVLSEITIADKNWRLGNYEILEEIGRGGMGVIYRARQRHSRRIVAVKRVLSYHADSQETLARFRREAQAAASLDHPNILPIYEVSESEDGLPFFSMKFAPGGSLQDASRALRDEPRQCVALVAKVARAVQHAHGKGILHRDLKPGNILLDGRGEPLVSDFGLAKWLDATSDLTRTLTIFGTPGYIAPEQASGPAAQLKPTADIYSLGAILFDLLAGRPPFLGSHALSVIRQAAENPAPKLRSLSKVADRDLETICARCLEREPSARYRSAHDLAEDLERWLEGRPIIARPVPPPVRLWRWSCRNRVLAGMIAACLLLGIAVVLRQNQNYRLSATVRGDASATHSIAVLPFLDLETVAMESALSFELVQVFEKEMSRIGPCRVVSAFDSKHEMLSAASTQDIKEIGRAFNVRTVLSGTTRTIGGRLHITLRLMNAATAEVLRIDVFDIEESTHSANLVAAGSADAIYAALGNADLAIAAAASRDPGLNDPLTRGLILSGRDLYYRYNLTDFDRAISCFEKALSSQPASAVTHAYLASALGARSRLSDDKHLLLRAESEAREAVHLAPTSGEARRALAGIMYLKGDVAAAVQEALNTVEAAGPDESVAALLGATYSSLGRPDRALAWYEVARHCESRPGEYDSLIGDCWVDLEEDAKAEAYYHQSADLRPDRPQGWVGACRLHLLKREFESARQSYQTNLRHHSDHAFAKQIAAQTEFFARNFPEAEKLYTELLSTDPDGGGAFYGAISYDSALARLAAARSDGARAQTLLDKSNTREISTIKGLQPDANGLFHLAAIASIRGERATAIHQLQAATAAGWVDYRSLILDPRFDQVRDDPDFQTILNALRSKIAEMRLAAVNHLENNEKK
jgi:serine/threonine protein kinase/tetratricopeptide (TPR) repeat protein